MRYNLLLIALYFLFANCSNSPKEENKRKVENNTIDSTYINSDTTNIDRKQFPPKFIKIIPQGYEIFDLAEGNLNLDSITDYIIIVNDKNEKFYSNRTFNRDSLKKRITMLIIGLPKDSFYVAASNNGIVTGLGSGGGIIDPYEGIGIDSGSFCFSSHGGHANNMWTITECFKYSQKEDQWFLDSTVEEDQHFYDGTSSTTIKTEKDFGKINFRGYSE